MSLSDHQDMLSPLVGPTPLGPDLVLPDGFVLPPWPQFVTLAVLLIGVTALLWALKPRISDWTALAAAPWIALGGVLHALHQEPGQVAEIPGWLDHFIASPAVYATVGVLAGVVWIASTIKAAMSDSIADRPLGVIGTGVVVMTLVLVTFSAFDAGILEPLWPAIILLVSTLLTAFLWIGVSLVFTETAAYTRKTGAVVVFAHVLDAISTWVGHDVLGYPERTPMSRAVISVGEQLPIPEAVGPAIVFVLVKIVLAIGILLLFREWTREEPQQARIVLLFVAAVGLGPAVHNIVLFAVTGAPA